MSRVRGVMMAAVALALASAAHGAPRLDYRGMALPSRSVERWAAVALAAPGDTTRLPELLGRVVGELQDSGFLDARAGARWEGNPPERLVVEIREGARFRLASIEVHALAARDSADLSRAVAVALAPGDVASPAAVARALEQALHDLTERGHPYASVGVRTWEAESAQVRLGLTGSLGPRVTISQVRLEGMRVTRPSFAEKSMGRLRGEPYNRAAALAARDRLLRLGLFREVQFDGLEGEADWSRGQLVYRVTEARFNTFEGALGMQGPAGPAGLVRLDLGNLLGTGRALGFRWEAHGHGVSRLGARFAEPLFLGTPLRLEGSFDQNVQDTLFVRTKWGARGRLALSSEERVEAGYEEERVVQEQSAVTEVRYRTTSLALERVTLDHPLAPRRGTRLRFGAGQTRKTEQLGPAGQRVVRAGNFEMECEWHRAVRGSAGLALEVQGRGRFSSERVLPLFERLPLGGAKTLRGHDEEELLVDRLVLSRLEWRWFLGPSGQRLALFWDHARSATRVALPEGGDHLVVQDHDGIGFGVRLEAGGGLIGLDYGVKPGRPPLEGKVHLQLISTF